MKNTAYLIQGTLVSLWWLGLAISEDFFAAFQFPGIPKEAFNSFLAPDILVVTVLSVVRAYKPLKELGFIILGGFAYGTLYCLNASILSGGGYLPSTVMFLGLFYNLFLVYDKKVFRESTSHGTITNALKTFVQIICVWSITLVLFPYIIIDAFDIQQTTPQSLQIVSYVTFGLASLLGLSSAFVIVKHGDGTPLPADQTKKLVVKGPYKIVRNPMALAGMIQGLSVALYFGSIHIAIYTLIGGVIWHIVVRPIEEKNMLNRFGDAYRNYKQRVRLWLPKLI